MRTAKAAVYEAPNTPFILKEFPVRPAKSGEVLVPLRHSLLRRTAA
jgi:Zn-dependent alcohol dehydrogenase